MNYFVSYLFKGH